MKGDRSKSDYPAYCFVGIKWDDNHLSLRRLFKICLGIIFHDIWFILSSIITDKRLLPVAGEAGRLVCSQHQDYRVDLRTPPLNTICVVDFWFPVEKRSSHITANMEWKRVDMKECFAHRFLTWACAKPLMLFVKHWLTTLLSPISSADILFWFCWLSVIKVLHIANDRLRWGGDYESRNM